MEIGAILFLGAFWLIFGLIIIGFLMDFVYPIFKFLYSICEFVLGFLFFGINSKLYGKFQISKTVFALSITALCFGFFQYIGTEAILNLLGELLWDVMVAFSVVLWGLIMYTWMSNVDHKAFMEAMEEERRQQHNQKLQDEIDNLKSERNGIKINNNLLDEISGSTLSDFELDRNRRTYDKIGEQIVDLERRRR